MVDNKKLSGSARTLISALEAKEPQKNENKLTVNPVVSQIAFLYEKLRNAMEYREDEVILRSAIERILRRRLLLGGSAETMAEPLLRELLWARYVPEGHVGDKVVEQVTRSINLHLKLRYSIIKMEVLPEGKINEWIYQLVSSDIAHIVSPNAEREVMASFMFQVLKDHINIVDDTTQTRDAQVFLAVRKAFNREDLALLRYQLFKQFFGVLDDNNLSDTAISFMDGYREINKQLYYPAKDRIYAYVKRKTPPFLILEDVLRTQKGNIKTVLEDEDLLAKVVYALLDLRYGGIASKVRRAVVRSVVFVLLTKVAIAFLVESSYERIFYGRIFLNSMLFNISIPPLLMIAIGLSIRIPGKNNSKEILRAITAVLYEDKPVMGQTLIVKKNKGKKTLLNIIFTILWFLAFLISFGAILFFLMKLHLHFNIVSEAVFLFFLAIVSFLSYRIILTASLYTVMDGQGILTPIIDFFFMPIVRVGRDLTEGISQINVVLFIFDLFIETPFKGLFSFFEQWFLFLHTKREELG